MMRKILVTGSAGFLGSNLCSVLTKQGHEVHGLDNLSTGSKRNIESLAKSKNFFFYDADLTLGLPKDLELRFDYIYHFASPASPPRYLALALETIAVNTTGTKILLDHVKKHGGRILFASTSEIYGDPLQHPQNESYWGNVNPIGPRSVYDEAKRLGETLVSLYQRNGWAETSLIRIFNTYGPHLDPDDGRVVSSFLRDGILGKPLKVFGDGTQTRSFCFVDDLIDGIVMTMEKGFTGPVNLGNPNEFTLLELAKKVGRVLGINPNLEFQELPQDDPKQRKPDISLATTKLGWKPTVELDAGLEITASWMKKVLL